jgi:predicted transcriptional regulator of viral defense system
MPGRAGFTPQALDAMVRRGTADRVGWGLYRFPAVPHAGLEQYMQATLWPRPHQGTLSHATALDLLDLCDVNPDKIHVTVPKGFRTRREPPAGYMLHRRDLAAEETGYYEGIPIVTPYRAILDGVETHLRHDFIEQAVDAARRRGRLTPGQLTHLESVLPN